MKISFECIKCKRLQVEDPKKTQTKVEEINGHSIEFKYYRCPVCSALNYVQADNEKSKELLSKCVSLVKVQVNANGQVKRGKQSGKAKKIQLHLRRIRNTLQEELKDSGIYLTDYKIMEE